MDSCKNCQFWDRNTSDLYSPIFARTSCKDVVLRMDGSLQTHKDFGCIYYKKDKVETPAFNITKDGEFVTIIGRDKADDKIFFDFTLKADDFCATIEKLINYIRNDEPFHEHLGAFFHKVTKQ